jgi:hypothetical protein
MSMLKRALSMPARGRGDNGTLVSLVDGNATLMTQGTVNVSNGQGRGTVKIMTMKEDYSWRPSIKRVSELNNVDHHEIIRSKASVRSMGRSQSFAPRNNGVMRERETSRKSSVSKSSAVELLLRPEGVEEDRQPKEEPSWVDTIREESVSGGRVYESDNRYLVENSSVTKMGIPNIPDDAFVSVHPANEDKNTTSSSIKKRLPAMMGMRRHPSSGRSLHSSISSAASSRVSSTRSTRSQRSRRSQGSMGAAMKKDYSRRPSIKQGSELNNIGHQEPINEIIRIDSSVRRMGRNNRVLRARETSRKSSVSKSSAVELLLRPKRVEEDRQPEEEPSWIDTIRDVSVSGGRAYESYNRYLVENSSVTKMGIPNIPDDAFVPVHPADDDKNATIASIKKRLPEMMGMRRHPSSGRSVHSSISSAASSRVSSTRSTRSRRTRRSQGSMVTAMKKDYSRRPSIKRVSELNNTGPQTPINEIIRSDSSVRSMGRSQSFAPRNNKVLRARETSQKSSVSKSSAVELLLRPKGVEEDRQPEEEPSWIDTIGEESFSVGRAYESDNRYLVENSSVTKMGIPNIPDDAFVSVHPADDDKNTTSASIKKRLPEIMGMRRHPSSGRSVHSSISSAASSRVSSTHSHSPRRQMSRRSQASMSSRSRRSSSSRSVRSVKKSFRRRRPSSSIRPMDTLAEAPEDDQGQVPITVEFVKKSGFGETSKAEKEPVSFFSSVASCIQRITCNPDEICSHIYDEQVEAGLVGVSRSYDDETAAYTSDPS